MFVFFVGVNKAVRIYRTADLIDEHKGATEARYPMVELSLRNKLSAAAYNPYLQQRLVVGDAEGSVLVLDTATEMDIVTYEEHTNRVWSVDCSPNDPSLILSASADTSARLWSTTQDSSVAVIGEDGQSQVRSTCLVALFCSFSNVVAAIRFVIIASCRAMIF
jgi:WD40 repeat protein